MPFIDETYLDAILDDAAGEDITYATGERSIALRAIRGKTDGLQADAFGVTAAMRTVDFIVPCAALEGITPVRGDTITDAAGRGYLVTPIGARPVAELSGANSLRIHTQETEDRTP